MEKTIFIIFIGFLFLSCKNNPPKTTKTDDYELIIPNNPKAILILFPGFNGDAERIKMQSKIPKEAVDNNISVLLLNSFNQHLFLYEQEKNNLEKLILDTLKEHQLENKNIFLGGFSSGGNVALLISDRIKTKGIFIIDSPLDLANFYQNLKKYTQNSTDKNEMVLSKYILKDLKSRFGNPSEEISPYEEFSPYISSTNFNYNIQHLINTSILLYTEPDLKWWKEHTNKSDFTDLNSYSIKKMYHSFIDLGHTNIEYIETTNKGFRANGTRSPHSWSIADEKEIVEWILKNN